MRLAEDRAIELLRAHSHGFMATQHPEHGIDVGPTVYAVVGDHLGSPVDLVKPKSSTRLQRERNLEHDPRATLAIEHWDRDDWSKLWWVRARLRWLGHGPHDQTEALADRLATSFAQYRDKPFATVHVFEIESITGWTASELVEV
jgi:Pyridoxamine 5'-phosphate oxidase